MAARYRGYTINAANVIQPEEVGAIALVVNDTKGVAFARAQSLTEAKALVDKHIAETMWTAARLIAELQRYPADTLILLDSGDSGDRVQMDHIDTNLTEGWVELQGGE